MQVADFYFLESIDLALSVFPREHDVASCCEASVALALFQTRFKNNESELELTNAFTAAIGRHVGSSKHRAGARIGYRIPIRGLNSAAASQRSGP
jgi:hypothetical protein